MTIKPTYNSRAVTFVLKNVELHYPTLGTPVAPNFGGDQDGPQWSVQARGIEESVAMDLKEVGLPIKFDEETGLFSMQLKQYTQTTKGKSNALVVVDNDLNDIPMETRETIGMGSKANVAGYFYTYTNTHGTGVSARLTDVQVTELVEKREETKEDRMKRLFG